MLGHRKPFLATLTILAASIAVAGAPTTADAQRAQVSKSSDDGAFGLGVMLGAPSGLSAKLYLGGGLAIDGAIGFVDRFRDRYDGYHGTHAHFDILWHPKIVADNPTFVMPLYVGIGARFESHHYDFIDRGVLYEDSHSHVGVRFPIGLVLDFNRAPIDIFMEASVVADFAGDDHDVCFDSDGDAFICDGHDSVDLGASIGMRYYF